MKRRRVKGAFCLLCLWSSGLWGGVHTIHSDQVMTLCVSSEGMTRISMDSEGIQEMFAYPSTESLKMHAGHVFVTAPEGKKPVFVTVIGASGMAQDLKLVFSEKKQGSPIVLKRPADPFRGVSKKQAERWIEASLAGDIPEGFVEDPVKGETRYSASVKAMEDHRYRKGEVVLSVWTVRSRGEKEIRVDLSSLLKGEEAGKLLKGRLLPGERTVLVTVSYEKGEKGNG